MSTIKKEKVIPLVNPNGVLTDKAGAKSSKRIIAMISIVTAIVLISFVVIAGCFIAIPSASLIVSLLVSLLATGLIAAGLSIPEWFSKLSVKK